ncbi:MAG: PmoA family protein [Candidatus Synoicihabitans palmerolidicus]|nr:PmoA family protein [Candidatus Synoicihabitans palmerolidicus]
MNTSISRIVLRCFWSLSLAWGFVIPVAAVGERLTVEETDALVMIARGRAPALTDHTALVPAPQGVSSSGFIHSLHAPNGGVVTSIHAKDHYHHMGLWHAWVHTTLRGRELDFWNVKKGEATVRFAGRVVLGEGKDRVGFTAYQEQVALAHDDEPEEVVLAERLTVWVHDDESAQVIDYEIEQTNVTDVALELPAYRYGGGIAYRAPENWGGVK